MAKDSSGIDQLKSASQDLVRNLGDSALDRANDAVSGLTEKVTDIGKGGGGGVAGKAMGKAGEAAAQGDNPVLGGLKGVASGVKDKITGGGGDSSGGGKGAKSTNIIESIDVGVPVSVAYNQWTEFDTFPTFMKKVESAEAESEEKITFKAQIFLSHRTWEATILEQVPDERIVWRSKGAKGHVDGAVTFHELGPNLTRILVVLEYHPQGFFEKTGNIWEAQGRRARAELRHFRRHVMTRTILEPDEVEGWRGVIRDGEVVESHEEHAEREEQEDQESGEESGQESDQDYEEEPEAGSDEEYADEGEAEEEYADEAPEDEAEGQAEDEPEDEYVDEGDEVQDEEEPEEEYVDEGAEPEDEAEDEYVDEEEPEEEPEEKPRRRRRSR